MMLPSVKSIATENAFSPAAIIGETEVVVDIKPDTLSTKSSGRWITCYITPSEGYDARDIDASSVTLEGVSALPNQFGYVDINEDGICELMVKFDRSTILADLLTITYEEYLVCVYLMHIAGSYTDGVSFTGTDSVNVFYNGWS